MRTRITPNTDTYHAVYSVRNISHVSCVVATLINIVVHMINSNYFKNTYVWTFQMKGILQEVIGLASVAASQNVYSIFFL